jgi:hypothetical protein
MQLRMRTVNSPQNTPMIWQLLSSVQIQRQTRNSGREPDDEMRPLPAIARSAASV